MRLAVVAAGFTPGEADQLRRAMGAWRRPGIIEQFRQKLIDGMLARGLSRRVRRAGVQSDSRVWRVRLSRIARGELCAAGLRVGVAEVPLSRRRFARRCSTASRWGFMRRPSLVRNAREHGVEVLPVDVNRQRVGQRVWKGRGNAECGVRNAELKTSDCCTPHSASALRLLRRLAANPRVAGGRMAGRSRRRAANARLSRSPILLAAPV